MGKSTLILISRGYSIRKTLWKNDMSERMNMSLTEKVSHVKCHTIKRFLIETINIACYLINMLPRASLERKVT